MEEFPKAVGSKIQIHKEKKSKPMEEKSKFFSSANPGFSMACRLIQTFVPWCSLVDRFLR
jgi:hypothetical protein